MQRFLFFFLKSLFQNAYLLGFATLLVLSPSVVSAQQAPPGYYLACAEGAECVIGPFSKDVAFGVGNQLSKRVGMSGSFTCSQNTFGGDPAKKQAKYCFISVQESRRQALAIGGTYFTVKPTYQRGIPSGRRVWYGVDGNFVEKEVVGNVLCGDQTFGDPANGRYKGCFIFQPW